MAANDPELKTLAGYTVGVTADRRSDEQISLLTKRGAECIHGPTVNTHPLCPETTIAAPTQELLANPPNFVILTTGIGVRGWLEAADTLLIGEKLRLLLGATRLLARGPKAHGSAVAEGLTVEWTAPSATTTEVLAELDRLAEPGDRIGIQTDGDPHQTLGPALASKGYDVVGIAVYRWSAPDDVSKASTLIRAVADRRIDLVTFTSRPAAENFAAIANEMGMLSDVRDAFSEQVDVVCIGTVCAESVIDLADQSIVPNRFRLGAMVATITHTLSAKSRRIRIGGFSVSLQGRLVAVAGARPVMLTCRERQILNALLLHKNAVVSKLELLNSVWSGSDLDPHVVEVTVGRLRQRLGPAGPGIETVIRRGYRVSSD